MSALTKEVQESAVVAGSIGVACTREVMVLNNNGGNGQAVRSLAEQRHSSLPDWDRLLARRLIEAVLPTFADLQRLRTQESVTPTWVDLWRTAGKAPELLEKVVGPAAQRLLECRPQS